MKEMEKKGLKNGRTAKPSSRSSGPLKIYTDESDGLFVTGFGLWIPVKTEKEGRLLIEELENQGYRICY
jgi:hypothetical protein